MAAAKVSATTVVQRNLPYIKQQLGAALQNSSAVVKTICITVIVCYFVSFSRTAIHVISVTPGYIIPPNFWVWTAFTHCFLENRLWKVLADVVTVGLCGKLLEPLWGAIEMLTFFAIVNTGVAFLSVSFFILVYTVTSDTDYLFLVHIHGLAGYCAGVSVAVKQIMPDHVLISCPLGKLRNRDIPLAVFVLGVVLRILRLVEGTTVVMFGTGILTSWVYLRFFQLHNNGTRGDMGENFGFASFFPNVLQPPIAIFSNMIFNLLVKMKLCKKPVRKYNMASTSSTITVNLPGTDPQDAERRRQIALRALTERLSKAESPIGWQGGDSEPSKGPPEKMKHVTIAIPPAPPHQPATTHPSPPISPHSESIHHMDNKPQKSVVGGVASSLTQDHSLL